MASVEDKITALIELGNSFEGNDTEKSRKTDQLKNFAEDLIKEQDAHDLAIVAGKLADAARKGKFDCEKRNSCMCLFCCDEMLTLRSEIESWRIPIGDSGILGLVLSSIPTEDLQHPLNRQALRLIGNSCADCGN